MPLRRRLLLLGAALSAAVALAALATLAVSRARDAAYREVRSLSVAAQGVARLRTAYVDQETGVRGFVVSGADEFLEPYDSGRRLADEQLAALRQELGGESAPLALLDNVGTAGNRWRAEAAELMIAARRAGDEAAAEEMVASGLGKNLFDPLRVELDMLAVDIEANLEDGRQRTDRLGTAQAIVPLATLAFVAMATVLAEVLLRRWVVRPVEDVREAALAVRSGQLDVHVPVNGPRELAELGAAVGDMRDTIVHQLDEAVRARQALEQDALVVVELRSQLGPYVGDLGDGWSAAAELRPAEGLVAGDCYDIVQLSPTRLACVVVDIAGHGAAGLLALRSKEQLRAALGAGLSPGEAVGNVAQQLTGLRDGMFLTAFVGLVDLTDGRCWYTNAGHPPAMMVTADELSELTPTGPLVGPIQAIWRTAETTIDPGTKLLVYTDGLTEARSAGGTMLGETRLAEALRGEACDEARVVLKQCFAELETFAPTRLHDDVTVVVLCRRA